jgi:protein arginine N-methyltransferase 1
MALLAARLGAGRVVALEPDDVIEVARQAAHDNDLGHRIEFRQCRSTELELANGADLIVSDLRGVLPLYGDHIPSVIDARERLLAPDGVLLPRTDTISLALVEAPDAYEKHVGCWTLHSLGFDLGAARSLGTNTWWRQRIEADAVLTRPERVAVLDYRTVSSPSLDVTCDVKVERTGTAHGLIAWFDTELLDGIGFSNAPERPEAIYGNAFFPLVDPLGVYADDLLHVGLRADHSGGEYVWTWRTRLSRAGETVVSYTQSTALGVPLTPRRLRGVSPESIVNLSSEGRATRRALELMERGVAVGEIARDLEESQSAVSRDGDALGFVTRLSQKFGA